MFGYALDGSLIDAATLLVGIIAIFVKPIVRAFRKQPKAKWFVQRDCGVDFLNGCSLVPFVCMAISVVSSGFMQEFVKSSKISLGIGAVIGLLFVVPEIFTGAILSNGIGTSSNPPSQ